MKYAFIGAGKMASAIIQGMLRAKLCAASEIICSSRSSQQLKRLQDVNSIHIAHSNIEAIEAAPVIILCVKPSDVATALQQSEDALDGKLLISVVGGVSMSFLKSLAPKCRIIRAMPNTAAMVGRSVTAFAVEVDVSSEDHATAQAIFSSIGTVFPVEEKLINAVTGVSGSGPAYVYTVIEALSDGGVAVGLPRKLALELAVHTVAGAAEMVMNTGEHPATLREMVASPGGTTIAGLAELEKHAIRAAFLEAVRAAVRRANELSQE